jgi:molecular chaperone GrpE
VDERIKRAEDLLQERLRSRTNGAPPSGAEVTEAQAASVQEEARSRSAAEEELVRDLQRLAADFANYRKRNEAERTEFARFAKADLIAKLLDVLDGYDRALETVPEELRSQSWVEGMWLVERKLRSILEAEGLVPVESMGRPFDPYVHEAVAHLESDEPEGTVIAEHQRGYRLHDRVIRPALVTVAKAPAAERPKGAA